MVTPTQTQEQLVKEVYPKLCDDCKVSVADFHFELFSDKNRKKLTFEGSLDKGRFTVCDDCNKKVRRTIQSNPIKWNPILSKLLKETNQQVREIRFQEGIKEPSPKKSKDRQLVENLHEKLTKREFEFILLLMNYMGTYEKLEKVEPEELERPDGKRKKVVVSITKRKTGWFQYSEIESLIEAHHPNFNRSNTNKYIKKLLSKGLLDRMDEKWIDPHRKTEGRERRLYRLSTTPYGCKQLAGHFLKDKSYLVVDNPHRILIPDGLDKSIPAHKKHLEEIGNELGTEIDLYNITFYNQFIKSDYYKDNIENFYAECREAFIYTLIFGIDEKNFKDWKNLINKPENQKMKKIAGELYDNSPSIQSKFLLDSVSFTIKMGEVKERFLKEGLRGEKLFNKQISMLEGLEHFEK